MTSKGPWSWLAWLAAWACLQVTPATVLVAHAAGVSETADAPTVSIGVVQADGSPPVVAAGSPFTVEWTTDAPFVSYVLTIDGTPRSVTLPAPAPAGVFSQPVSPGVAAGDHTITVAVCNEVLCSDPSVPVPFVARPKPASPTAVRVRRP